MVSSSGKTRATRSRISSPAVNGSGETAKHASKEGKTLLDRWLEPPVQHKASYQEAGLVRHGVLENMAPLGTMPKVGIFKKTVSTPPVPVPESAPFSRKIILKRPTPSTTRTATQPRPPQPQPRPTQTEDAEEDEDETEEEPEKEEDEDDEEVPQTRRSLPTGRNMDDDWTNSIAGRQDSFSSSSANGLSNLVDNKEGMDKVVQEAIEQALAHFRYPTAWALRTLYDENSTDPEFVAMMEKVCLQTADAETWNRFAKLMEAKKREGKKDKKAYYYFVPAGSDSPYSPNKAQPAPYGHLVKTNLSAMHDDRSSSTASAARDSESETVGESGARETAAESDGKVKLEAADESEKASADQRQMEEQSVVQSVEEPVKRGEKQKVVSNSSSRAAVSPARPTPPSATEAVPETATTESEMQKAASPARTRECNGRKKRKLASTKEKQVKVKLHHTPSSKRRRRANSASSSSPLSSARSMTPPAGIESDDDVFEVAASHESPAAAEESGSNKNAPPKPKPVAMPEATPEAAPKARPITSRQRANAAKRNGNVSHSHSRTTVSPPAVQSSTTSEVAVPFSMPAEVETTLFPNLNGKKPVKIAGQSIVFPSKVGKLDENDEKWQLRRSAKQVTDSSAKLVQPSESRPPSMAPQREAVADTTVQETTASSSCLTRPRSTQPPSRPNAVVNGRSTRSSLKRAHDEVEDQPSPTSQAFQTSEVASTESRAGTPGVRAAKKPRIGLRVKTCTTTTTTKKKTGTFAGIPRPSGERSPAGFGVKDDENDDYCSSCSGNGDLLCCDGCTRSFHLHCVDPPLIQGSMPAEWFCNVCRITRVPARLPSGPFTGLMEKLEPLNSRAFRLPKPVRGYFDSVKTGVDGEYEETQAVPPKPTGKGKKKQEEEQNVDYLRLMDPEGRAIICHHCQLSASDAKAIIPCSLCGLSWHLDCLDPPLANPPHNLRSWKCPAHVDDLLAKLPGALGPAHRFRKIKGAPVVQPAYSRGYISNGHVDVRLDESDDESGWKDVETYGKIVRLPEKGIKLDFLSRIRENRKGKRIPPITQPAVQPELTTGPGIMSARELEHQQAAHNLVQLSQQDHAGISTLVDAMLSSADSATISLMARSNVAQMEQGRLNQMDEQTLLTLLANVEQMQSAIKGLLPNQDTAASLVPSGESTVASAESQVVQPMAKENLPSPAATECVVSGAQTDDKVNESAHQMSLD